MGKAAVDKATLMAQLAEVVGSQYVTDEDLMLRAYSQDFGIMPARLPDIVVRPKTTEDVSAVVKIANAFKVPVIPRGGGSAQEGGCIAPDGGIIIETLRMEDIIEIDELNATVTCQAGIIYVKLLDELEAKGWKIGIVPSGALAGTPGAHIARPGIGWGNIKYISSGDQVLGVKAVLPNGDIVETATAANPTGDVFYRYAIGPDMTGLFVGAEGAFGIITECTMRMFRYPEKIYLERFSTADLPTAIELFRQLATQNLVVYISAPLVRPGESILFDINVEGVPHEVDVRAQRVRELILSFPGIESLGTEMPQKFWEYRWYLTGDEFKDGIAGVVNFFLPFDKLESATHEMKAIMDRHGVNKYVQQLFPGPTSCEHVNLLFFHPDDTAEREKIRVAMDEMMDRALAMGGAPYSKGRQWAPHLEKHLGDTGYWRLTHAIKQALDPNGIMNPGVVGL